MNSRPEVLECLDLSPGAGLWYRLHQEMAAEAAFLAKDDGGR